jgi:hypothetical protein
VAILGAEPARFARYEAQIEAEYAPRVGLAAYRGGGAACSWRRWRGAAALFRTPFFGERLEARARANLARALAGPPLTVSGAPRSAATPTAGRRRRPPTRRPARWRHLGDREPAALAREPALDGAGPP